MLNDAWRARIAYVLLAIALLLLLGLGYSRTAHAEEHKHHHQAHGGLLKDMPYDPYAGSGCCNGTDCRPSRHKIVGSKLFIEAEGEVLEFDLSDSKIKEWSFKITDEEVRAGKIDPRRDAFRRLLERSWHWCGYRDDKNVLQTRCILRPPQHM